MPIWDCYFDTAGSQAAADGLVLVTVGVIAEREKWTRFDRRWLRVLENEGVRSLHMKEFAHSKGQYAEWKNDEPRRAAFLKSLAKEAKRGINKAFITAVVLPDYHAADERYQLTEVVGGPYSLAQAGGIGRSIDWLLGRIRPTDGVGIYLEKGDTGQPAFRAFMKRERSLEPHIVSRVNDDGEEITPFQVADFIAYEHRYAYDKYLKTGERVVPRKSMSELRRMLPLKVGILDAASIERFCEGNVPPRVATPPRSRHDE